LRCDSESFGVGNLPLRSASSVNIRASSLQSPGDVLIVIAIVFISLLISCKVIANFLYNQLDKLIKVGWRLIDVLCHEGIILSGDFEHKIGKYGMNKIGRSNVIWIKKQKKNKQ
jgi:hypothetical protein